MTGSKKTSPKMIEEVYEPQNGMSKGVLSGFFKHDSIKRYVSNYLKNMSHDDVCAMFLVEIEDFDFSINDENEESGEKILEAAAERLSRLFRATDLIGNVDQNKFIVFITDPSITNKALLNKAEQICRMNILPGASLRLMINIGIYAASGASFSFGMFYAAAAHNLEQARKNRENHICITSDIKRSDNVKPPFTSQPHPVIINALMENMGEIVRLVEVGKTVRQIYINRSSNNENIVLIHPHDASRYGRMLHRVCERECAEEDEYRVSYRGQDYRYYAVRDVKVPYPQSEYPVLLEILQDISEVRKKEQRLAECEKMLSMAFENTTRVMWEVDIKSKQYTFVDSRNGFGVKSETIDDFPESLIAFGWVHPDSAAAFREFGNEILNDKPSGSGSFILRYRASESYGWASMSYSKIFDKSGLPVKAIGVKTFMVDDSERKTGFVSFPKLPDAVYPTLVMSIKANLSKDLVKELWFEGSTHMDISSVQSCSDVIETERKKLFNTYDSKEFLEEFSREAMLKAASSDTVWETFRYRRIDSSGNIHWVLNTINLIKDQATQQVYLFDYVNDIERRHIWENGTDIGKDETGFYDMATAKQIISKLLAKETSCAVSLIHINGFASMEDDEYGSAAQKQMYISSAFSLSIGSETIVGRCGEEDFLVFLADVSSRSAAKKQLEDAFAFVRSAMSGTTIMRTLKFIAGCVYIQEQGWDVELILRNLRGLCSLWKNSASDTVVFMTEKSNEEELWHLFEPADGNLSINWGRELLSALSDDEKDVALNCLAGAFLSGSADGAVRNILKNIGQYYNADRVYLLALAENKQVITMMYEWTAEGKLSIQRAVSGMRIGKFPFLCRCMQEKKPVFMKNSDALSPSGRRNGKSSWNYIALPVMNQKELDSGFFCIENPQLHIDRVALPTIMVKYILSASHNKRLQPNEDDRPVDSLTTLPNLRSYSDVIDSVSSDIYSSLGALALDIPNLPAINSMQGFEYGSKLILHVSEVLAELFGRSYLFRTWDSEFVALCPNTTIESFIERCTRARGILQSCYRDQIRIGYTWSSGVFYAKNLVKEAKSIMRCQDITAIHTTDRDNLWGVKYSDFGSAAQSGKFEVYFQPKIDMRTEAVVGAEALIRGIDEDGSLIPPSKFIDAMEKNRTIRELDFFVLDRTLEYMEKWYEEGFDPIKISVNISRVTLLDPNAPASMLAIQSRYPEILSGMIELEITESGLDIEKATLSHILDNFRQVGMEFALDDFGSHYSNMAIFTNVKFNTVKLDRGLVNELASNEADRLLVKNIIQICKNNGMTCIAEGVETKAQVAVLLNMGCSICQGYYYSKPLSAEEFKKKWLENAMEE